MNNTVALMVGHRLGKAEAVRRLKEGLARTHGNLGPMIAIHEDTWEGDTLRFNMSALGQAAEARIEVLDEALHIEVTLPWLLAKVANRFLRALHRESTRLLEKR